ncbi:MAG: sulfite exporter TauE/SafE family protein [Limnohabitans sp.]|nr:sulfite exporter TauE/SafE family protein [Limnohabitans sp.]
MITDPFFYLVGIPAVLVIGISKSGFGAGFGALAVPLMSLSLPVSQAAAIFMPILLATDMLAMSALRRDFDKQLLKFILPWGILGVVVGYFTFRILDSHAVAGILGLITLLFLAHRIFFKQPDHPLILPNWFGAIMATIGGFTSFIAHSGSPPLNTYLLPMRLSPLVFSATLSYHFFALNMAKWVPYAALGLLDLRNMATSVVLLPLVPVGVWVGINVAKRVSQKLFYNLVHTGMFLTGLKLSWDGFQ